MTPSMLSIEPTSRSIDYNGVMATAEAPVNIALIKYWGKRPGGEHLNIPLNDTISVCLVNEDPQSPIKLKTCTTISFNTIGDQKEDVVVLNGKDVGRVQGRIERVLRYFRKNVSKVSDIDQPSQNSNLLHYERSLRIETINYFPTAAGLASSASGFAALARALVGLCPQQTTEDTEKLAAILARLGSGSACRSAPQVGGVVLWKAGERSDGLDSLPHVLYPPNYWPELKCLVVIMDNSIDATKQVSSAEGMQRSVQTAFPAIKNRLEILPDRTKALKIAFENQDFPTLARIIMNDSDDFHGICAASHPPLHYLTPNSCRLIEAIRHLNEQDANIKAGYTFDAGPHAFVFHLLPDREVVKQKIREVLPQAMLVQCRIGNGSRLVNVQS